MLKLYKNTIIISSAVAIFGLLFSILCEVYPFSHSTFIQNILVGISCSLIVVVITTILQYRAEHTVVFENYSEALRELLFYLRIINDNPENSPSQKQYELFHSKFNELFHKVHQYDENLCWFSVKKARQQEQVFQLYARIAASFMAGSVDSHKKGVDALINHVNFNPLVDATIKILPDNYDKEFIQKYIVVEDKIEAETVTESDTKSDKQPVE